MSTLLLDLDNTLIDRDAAFRRGVSAFLSIHALPADDVDWVMAVDLAGYAPRDDVAAAMAARWNGAVSDDDIGAFLRRGAADFVLPDEAVDAAVRKAISAGWRLVVVTNGRTEQQRAKLRNSGLDRIIHGWVISEDVGSHKPERAIFDAAVATVGGTLDAAWMIGDNPIADIGGAAAVGMPSVWLSLGRAWPADLPYEPTHIADGLPAAVDHVLGSGEGPVG